MEIAQLRLMEITSGELESNMCLGIGNDIETDILCTLIKIPGHNNYQIDITTLSEAFVNTNAYYIEVISKFRLKILDGSTQLKTESDFMVIANLIQIALANARVILYEKTKTLRIRPVITNMELIRTLYNKLVAGDILLFNFS